MALYHTHRPQTFDDLIDQAHIVTTLKNQLIHDKTAHAYLFSGPRGVGKTTTARILAKSINCTTRIQTDSNPCNTCNSCVEITGGRSIDVIEIDAASHTGVENVRQNIIDSTQFKPTMSKFKIFIIDEVHMLSTAAFNALLKTLEEPPKYIFFILATTDPKKLPATIISRCQRFGFHKVSDEKMTAHITHIAQLEHVKIDDEVVRRIVKKSEGCARDAVSLLDQLMAAGDTDISIDSASLILPATQIELQMDFVEYILHKNQTRALTHISDMVAQGVSLPHFARELIEFMRVLMISTIDIDLAQKEMDLSVEAGSRLKELSLGLTQREIVSLIDMTLRRSGEIKSSPLPQLPLEMLVVEWCAGVVHDTDTQTNIQRDTHSTTVQTPKIEATTKNIEARVTPVTAQKKEEEPIQVAHATEKKLEEQIATPIHNTQPIDQKTFESKWPECIKKIEVETPSLVFILKMAKFLGLEQHVAHFSVEYGFHQEKLMEKLTREKLESIISTVIGTSIRLDISTESTKSNSAPNLELEKLASALGGHII